MEMQPAAGSAASGNDPPAQRVVVVDDNRHNEAGDCTDAGGCCRSQVWSSACNERLIDINHHYLSRVSALLVNHRLPEFPWTA